MRYHEEPLRLVRVCVRVLEMRAAECIRRQQTYEDGGRIIQRVCVWDERDKTAERGSRSECRAESSA